MMTSRRSEQTDTGDGLAILLDTERRLAARTEAAAEEARAIVAAADREARRRLDALDARLRAEQEALAQSLEAGAANRIAALRSQAEEAAARHRTLDDETMLALARRVVAIVVGAGEDPPA